MTIDPNPKLICNLANGDDLQLQQLQVSLDKNKFNVNFFVYFCIVPFIHSFFPRTNTSLLEEDVCDLEGCWMENQFVLNQPLCVCCSTQYSRLHSLKTPDLLQ